MSNLYKQHASASALGQRALSVFHGVVDDLKRAAAQHEEVANEAQQQIQTLSELRDSATAAARDNIQQATAVSQLVARPQP